MNRYFRHIAFSALLVLTAFGSVVLTQGCKSKCGTTTCQNGGACTNDSCVCTTGYSGTSCETLWTTAYLGSYTCTQTCTPTIGSASWQSTITAGSTNGSYTLSISNFGNFQAAASATIDGNGNVTVYGTNIAGNGTFANNVLSIHYTTSTNNVPGYTCSLTMTKN